MTREGEPRGTDKNESPKPTFEERMTRAVSIWAENHPRPDEPVLSLADRTLTPRELAQEVADGTEIGNIQMEAFRLTTFPQPSTHTDPRRRQIIDARHQAFAQAFMGMVDTILGDNPPQTGTPAPGPRRRR